MPIVRITDGSTTPHPAETVGAKAAGLARMAALGLPVPPAFVLPIGLSQAIAGDEPHARHELIEGLTEGIAFLEQATRRRFGDRRHPLLVSVRSGAARSMPGMLDTVLNVGCTPAAIHGLVRMTGHPRFAWDCRRRFLESYAGVALGLDADAFARRLAQWLISEEADGVAGLDGEALERLADCYLQMIEDEDCVVPDDPMEQLETAAQAVYRSWTSDRARTYRRLQHLEDLRGTAVTVQAMVFGNRGQASAAGVAFSRDPSTGAAEPVIDVLFEAQGEDIVSGSRTPDSEDAIVQAAPAAAVALRDTLTRLEREFADVQDVEFTIEEGRLWILQNRPAKRTPLAALRVAIDFVNEGRITPAEALRRLDGIDLAALTTQRLADPTEPIARATGASAGIAAGRAAFDSDSAGRMAAGGDPIILIRPDTSTEDVGGFAASAGIVTAVGGRTAHAALVARQMGKPCVVGCAALTVDAAGHRAQVSGAVVNQGDWLTIDGGSGAIYLGQCRIVVEQPEAELAELARWHGEVLASA